MNDEKAFSEVWIILLLLIAAANDLATAFFSLLAFTGVGLAGEGIMIPINALLGAFFAAIFILKLGWGGASGLSVVGSLVEFFIPSRLLTVGGAIWIANHPKSLAGKAVKTVGEVESGGTTKLEEGAEKVREIEQSIEKIKSGENQTGEIRTKTDDRADRTVSEQRPSENESPDKSEQAVTPDENRDLELAMGALQTPDEQMQETFEKTPTSDEAFPKEKSDDTAPTSPKKSESNGKPARSVGPKFQDIKSMNSVPPIIVGDDGTANSDASARQEAA